MADPKFTTKEAMSKLVKLKRMALLERCEHAIACMSGLAEDYEKLADEYDAKAAALLDPDRRYLDAVYREEASRYRSMARAYRYGVCALVESSDERHARWREEEKAQAAEQDGVDSEGAQCG